MTGFRIRAFTSSDNLDADWQSLASMVFEVPMRAPSGGAPPTVIGNAAIFNPSWNAFAHRVFESNSSSKLPTAEPPKVGVILPERYRVGNLVWRDDDNDGTAETDEPGLDGVSVELWSDSDATPGPSAGDTQVGAAVTTTGGGKYSFDALPAGDYYVVIPAGQAVLARYLSSSNGEETDPDADVDNNDNGVRVVDSGPTGPVGIASGVLTLGIGASEPDDERLRSGSGTDDDADSYPDRLSNVSLDFGFFSLDFGDLPDDDDSAGSPSSPGYNTDAINTAGPSHIIIDGLGIGAVVDSEPAGQPDAAAGTPDDEDGVSFPPFIPGQTASVTIAVTNTTGAAATVYGFIDFDGDGAFTSAGETQSSSVAGDGSVASVTLDFPVPASPALGQSLGARFRISTDAGLGPDGAASPAPGPTATTAMARPTTKTA